MNIGVAVAGIGIRWLRVVDRPVTFVRVARTGLAWRRIWRRRLLVGRSGIASGDLVFARVGRHVGLPVVEDEGLLMTVMAGTRLRC